MHVLTRAPFFPQVAFASAGAVPRVHASAHHGALFPQVAFASAGAVPRVQRSSKVEEGFFGSSAEVCVPAECVLVPSSGEEVAAEAFVEMVDTGVVTPTASAAISPAAAEPSTAVVGAPPAADSSVRTGADSSVRTADSSVEAAILFESLLTEVGTPDCT